jgi:hypothetical protein
MNEESEQITTELAYRIMNKNRLKTRLGGVELN